MILHYFPEYLTPMLTLGPRSYRSPNLVLVLQMWENLESNLPVCPGQTKVSRDRQRETTHEICCLAAELSQCKTFFF